MFQSSLNHLLALALVGEHSVKLLGKLVVIVGLEAGYIFAYKAGWQISVASIVQSSFLAAALIFVGFLLYHEAITWNKLLGVLVCLTGLVIINMK